MTVKPFAGNWVDIGPGADDGTGDLVQGRLGTNCAAGMDEQHEQPAVSQPSSVPVPSWGELPGDQAATWLIKFVFLS